MLEVLWEANTLLQMETICNIFTVCRKGNVVAQEV